MKVLITGSSGYFGTLLTKKLEEDPEIKEVIGIDIEPETLDLEKVLFFKGDTRKKRVEEIFQIKKNIDAIVHLAYHTSPQGSPEEALNTNVFGTLRMLQLARKYNVEKFIFPSSSIVYGALPNNPPLLTENHILRGNRNFPFIRDKIEVDMACQLFASSEKPPKVIILRPCGIFRRKKTGILGSYLESLFVPIILGFDPMFQVIFEEDVIQAFILALKKDVEGIFNLAGKITCPLSEMIKRLKRLPIPLPEPLVHKGYKALFKKNFYFDFNYIKYPFCVDFTKAKNTLGYDPKY